MKPRDVQILSIADQTTVLRSRTWDRLKFEIEYGLQKGTTANTYLIQADRSALIDPPGQSFTEIFLDALKGQLDLSQLDYIVLGHINPNRGETLKALLTLAPQATLICSNPGAISLQKILPEHDLKIEVIKGEETLDLGQGHQLEFVPTPIPRWSDHLCFYDPKTQILYTGKLFGSHVCGDEILDQGWQVYREDRQYYFDCLMAPHATQVELALEKLIQKSARLYAPGHGPLVRYGLTALTQSYRNWLAQHKTREHSVALIYASAYGNTATIAQALARGITKAGVAVECINCEFAKPEEIRTAVEKSAGFIIGSPTLGGHAPTQIQTTLGIILSAANKNQLTGVFGSYGWSGEAISLLEGKIKDAGYRLGFEPIRVKFKPSDLTLKYCEEAGTDFAQKLKQQQKRRVSKTLMSESQTARTEQAVGRLVGSLCVVSAKKGELTGAMLASWVSQATFNPPGLTVAVAKERAIESLLYKGDCFVLNILPEGKQVQKQFMKKYAPLEDRFAGVETEPAENGCPVLKEALAYLECRVENRMDCGDHWLIYAVAEAGKVLDDQGVTAVNQGKYTMRY